MENGVIATMRTLLAATFLLAPAMWAQSLTGLWDATITVNEVPIPFRMEFSGSGSTVAGSFFNGDEKWTSTAGRFEKGALRLSFNFYGSRLEAAWKDGALDGAYIRDGRTYAFHAVPASPVSVRAGEVPLIAGQWEMATQSSKGEAAWHLIVRQSGAEVSAAILRVDGDTGTLTGLWKDGKFVLSHFSGARPSLLEITPQKDGSLEVVQNGRNKMTAWRSAEARAKGLAEPDDPAKHTSVKDPSERFHFRFPDLAGNIVSDTDARFQNKVVIVAIGGTWCPNCHDEAPFLVELYRRYHASGLEIVALDFEDAEQLKDPARVRAFIQRYGIEYPVLIAGETDELNAKVPQAVNLDAWPTTFFLGRDGRVRTVHAGFAGAASGEFHKQLRAEVTTLVEGLLAENKVSER